MSSPRKTLETAKAEQNARRRLYLRYIITYAVLLLLVLGYIWYNRLSSRQELVPEDIPQPVPRESTRFQLAPVPAPDLDEPPAEAPAEPETQ